MAQGSELCLAFRVMICCSSLPPACLSQRGALYEAGTIFLYVCQNVILAGYRHNNDNILVLMLKSNKTFNKCAFKLHCWYPFAPSPLCACI